MDPSWYFHENKKDPRIDLKHVRLGNLSEWTYFFEKHGLMIEKDIGINFSLIGKLISFSKTSFHIFSFHIKEILNSN